MARIPVGNFGYRGSDPVQHTRVANPGTDDLDAAGRLAGTVNALATKELQKQRAEDEALARAKATNALWNHELQVRGAADDIAERVSSGELDYQEAEGVYQERVSKIEPPQVNGLDAVTTEQMRGGLSRNAETGRQAVARVTGVAKRADFRGQFFTALDSLGKLAGQPDANVDAIHAKAEAFTALARQAEIPPDQITRAVQDFKDKNWTNHATARYIGGKDDAAALTQLEHDLTAEDGFYSSRLDTDKRNAILSQVSAGLTRLETRATVAADKREAVAEREVTWFRDQIVTGQEITAERWQEGMRNTEGTTQAEAFQVAQRTANEVLEFRVRPFAEQQQYLRALEAQNNTTPSEDPKRDKTRLDTLRAAMDSARKQAQDSPLTFYQEQTGVTVEPLALNTLASGNADLVQAQIAARYATLGALRKTYGEDVALNPWLPEEVTQLRSFFEKADDRGRLALLSTISGAAPTPAAYAAALKPVAADEPLYMAAGLAQYRKLQGPDGTDLATTILAGSRILEDKSVPMPGDAAMRRAFDERVGGAMPPGTSGRQRAFEVFQAVYAGRGQAKGIRHEDVGGTIEADEELADDAIALATGGVSEINGAKVLRPYGMPEDQFEARLSLNVRSAATAAGLDVGLIQDMPLQPVPGQEGAYHLLNDGAVQLDPKTRKPIVVTVQ